MTRKTLLACVGALSLGLSGCAGIPMTLTQGPARASKCSALEVQHFLNAASTPFIVNNNRLAEFLGSYRYCRVETTTSYSMTPGQSRPITAVEDVSVDTKNEGGTRSGCVDRYTRFLPREHFRYCFDNNALVEILDGHEH